MNDGSRREAVFWRVFRDIRGYERPRFLFFATLSAVITLGQTIGLAGTDALFLARLGPGALPAAFIVASVVTVATSLLYALVVGRVRNDALFTWMLAGTAILLGAAFFGLETGAEWILVALLVGTYTTQALFVNLHFWTFAADYFDTLSSKRVVPFLVMAGSVGGIVGGVLGVGLSRNFRTESLIIAWGVALLGAAGLVRVARRSLQGWIPVGDEADDSSVQGLSGALRYTRRSRLARWLMVSIVGMVLAVFVMQYLEMVVLSEIFESPARLASFFAVYLAVTNGIEIVIAAGVAPALLHKLGVARTNLIHPFLTIIVFVGLVFDPRLWSAVFARASREMMDNSLAGPVRALAYNALPFRFRGRMRALLEGVVYYAAMSVAGVILLVLAGSVDPMVLGGVGAAAAATYLGANWVVRREYMGSLIDELRSGHLDLDGVRGRIGTREVSRLAGHWERALAGESEPSTGWLQLPSVLASHGLYQPLHRLTSHPHAPVRTACVEALAGVGDPQLRWLLPLLLEDDDWGVRLAAARAAGVLADLPDEVRGRLRGRLGDARPEVRAEAARHLAADGIETLRLMLSHSDPLTVVEALARSPRDLLPEARSRLEDSDAGVRASALQCAARLNDQVSLTISRLETELAHVDPRVRRAATRALATHRGQSAHVLARALDDPVEEVRAEAVSGLAAMGETGRSAALPSIMSRQRTTVGAALLTVSRAGGESSRQILEKTFRRSVRDAWTHRVSQQLLARNENVPARFLGMAFGDAADRSLWIAFQVLELLEDPLVVRSVRKALEYRPSRRRADALEVLSNLGHRNAAALLALFLEESPLEDKLPNVATSLRLPTRADDVIRRAARSSDPWLKLAASHVHFEPSDTIPGVRVSSVNIPKEVRIMESLLALRKVMLFSHLTLDQLGEIGRFTTETEYMAGEVVVREGDMGSDLFVIVEGEARAFRNFGTTDEIQLTTMNPSGVSYFGEIAILDHAPRSATVVATQDMRVLTLDGARFTEMITQSPAISFEIFKVLTSRLRTAEERIRAQEDKARGV
jgi:HEAT repeat protein